VDEQAAEDRLDLHAEARPGDLAVRNQLVGYFLGFSAGTRTYG
jgi:hypothetical protein